VEKHNFGFFYELKISKKLLKVSNRPIGENSPNLVTLAVIEFGVIGKVTIGHAVASKYD
jgi:hypothetical protein